MDMIETLAKELSIGRQQAESAVRLLDEDNTIPFIARYRKEVTGGLDDTVLRALEERLRYLRSLQKRREEVFALIQASGKLNEQQLNQVEVSLQRASLLSEVEDIYRPYKQKRKTRASAAERRVWSRWRSFCRHSGRAARWNRRHKSLSTRKKEWRMLHRRLPVRRTSWQSS